MAEESTKTTKSTTVRIAVSEKERLQEVLLQKSAKEKRTITEMETVTKVVSRWVKRERKKLGLA